MPLSKIQFGEYTIDFLVLAGGSGGGGGATAGNGLGAAVKQ